MAEGWFFMIQSIIVILKRSCLLDFFSNNASYRGLKQKHDENKISAIRDA